MNQHELDAMLGAKLREQLVTRSAPYRDGYVDGWVDMETEYKRATAKLAEVEKAAGTLDCYEIRRTRLELERLRADHRGRGHRPHAGRDPVCACPGCTEDRFQNHVVPHLQQGQ